MTKSERDKYRGVFTDFTNLEKEREQYKEKEKNLLRDQNRIGARLKRISDEMNWRKDKLLDSAGYPNESVQREMTKLRTEQANLLKERDERLAPELVSLATKIIDTDKRIKETEPLFRDAGEWLRHDKETGKKSVIGKLAKPKARRPNDDVISVEDVTRPQSYNNTVVPYNADAYPAENFGPLPQPEPEAPHVWENPREIGETYAALHPGAEKAPERKRAIEKALTEYAETNNIPLDSMEFYKIKHDAIDGEKRVLHSPENIRKAIIQSLNPRLINEGMTDIKGDEIPAEYETDATRWEKATSFEKQQNAMGFKRSPGTNPESTNPDDYEPAEDVDPNIYKLGPEAMIPKWHREEERNIIAESRKLNHPLRPRPIFPGERIPGESRHQDYARGFADKNLIDAEKDKAATYAAAQKRVEDAGNTEVAPGMNKGFQRALESPLNRIADYMDPYTQNVIDQLTETSNKNFRENLIPAINSEAIAHGKFYNGSRQKSLEKAAVDLQDKLNLQIADLKRKGYHEAMGHLDANQEREMRGTVAKAAAAENDLSRKMSSAKGIVDLDKSDLERKQGVYKISKEIGDQERLRERETADQKYADWVEQQNWPTTKLQSRQEFLHKMPLHTPTIQPPTPYKEPVNPYTQMGGLFQGAGFASMGNQQQRQHAHGGSVRGHFADGGSTSYEEDVNKYISQLEEQKREPWVDFMAQAGFNTAKAAAQPGVSTLSALAQGHADAYPAFQNAQMRNENTTKQVLQLKDVIRKSRLDSQRSGMQEAFNERKMQLEEKKADASLANSRATEAYRNNMLALNQQKADNQPQRLSEEDRIKLVAQERTKSAQEKEDHKRENQQIDESKDQSKIYVDTLDKLGLLQNLYDETNVLAKGMPGRIPVIGELARNMSSHAPSFNQVATAMAAIAAKERTRGSISDYEGRTAIENSPNINQTPEALKRSINIQKALFSRLELKERFDRNAIWEKVPEKVRQQAWEKFRDANPVYDAHGNPVDPKGRPEDYLSSREGDSEEDYLGSDRDMVPGSNRIHPDSVKARKINELLMLEGS